MYIFLSAFFFLYGLIHYYFYLKLRDNVVLTVYLKILVIFTLTVLVFSPLAVRLLERAEIFTIARVFAFIGYIWMAFVFLFFSISVSLFLIKKLVKTNFNDFYFSVLLAIVFLIYGVFEAKKIVVEKLEIYSDKFKKGEMIKIVQISDVHLGIILKDKFTKKIIEIIEELSPDILVATGDLVDGQSNDISNLTKYFEKITPPLGKYAILGNHEFYVGLNNSISFLEKSGFTILRNKSVNIKDNLILAGIDDDTVKRYEGYHSDDLSIFKDLRKDAFVVFLKHKPKIEKETLKYFDLQLSGHTHNGQIFPFTLIVKIFFPVKSGLSVFKQDDKITYLYNSRGTGTWGPPVRFFSKPEVTLIEIIGSK